MHQLPPYHADNPQGGDPAAEVFMGRCPDGITEEAVKEAYKGSQLSSSFSTISSLVCAKQLHTFCLYAVSLYLVLELGDDCITNIRWLTNKDDGSFKGVGFVQFKTPELAGPFPFLLLLCANPYP